LRFIDENRFIVRQLKEDSLKQQTLLQGARG